MRGGVVGCGGRRGWRLVVSDISQRKCGENVKKLAFAKFTREVSSVVAGVHLLKSLGEPEGRKSLRECFEWVFKSIDLVKSLPGKPYGDDDESIARAILAKIDETNAKRGGGA